MSYIFEALKFGFFLLVIFLSIGPVGTVSGDFNSDGAIPIIMATTETLTPFHFYYFGQDRLGGWPFMMQWLMNHFLPISYGPKFCFLFQSSLFAAAALSMRTIFPKIPLIGSILVAASLLHPTVRQYFHEINNPYAIQTALCVFYWALSAKVNRSRKLRPLDLSLMLLVCCLAVWTSPATIVFIGMIQIYEGYWSLKHLSKAKNIFLNCIPVMALGFEKMINTIYHSYVNRAYEKELKTINFSVTTDTQINLDGFWDHLNRSISSITSHYSLAWFAILSIVAVLIYRKNRWVRQLDMIKMVSLVLVIATSTLIISSITWVRLNGHNVRYHIPQIFWMNFILMSVCASITFILLERKSIVLDRFKIATLSVAFLLGLTFRPSDLESRLNKFSRLQEISRSISSHFEGSKVMVLGSYWDSYKWQGLDPERIVGQPIEQESTRFPNNLRYLSNIPVVSCFGPGDRNFKQFDVLFSRGAKLPVPNSCQFYQLLRVSPEDERNESSRNQDDGTSAPM